MRPELQNFKVSSLSIVVTSEGKPDSIYVLKGAPFGLTAKAIADVRSWEFKPAQKDGTPVPVRVPVEISFRLF
jgi:TonB family protein